MKSLFRSALALSLLGCSAMANSPQNNLIQNGSFESYEGFTYYSNIQKNLTGWTIHGFGLYFGGIDIVIPSSAPGNYWEPADGLVSISLNWGTTGAVSQAVATTVGVQYTLTFSMAAEIFGGPALRTMDVLWNGEVIASPSFTYTGQTPDNMGWVQLSYDVVGTGNDTLMFKTTTEGNYGPAIDNVSLVPVPEPSGLALLALGALTTSVLRLRRKNL